MARLGVGIAALLGVLALVDLIGLPDDDQATEGSAGADNAMRRSVFEQRGPPAAPVPPEPRKLACHTTARVRRAVTLYRKPDGRPLMTVPARTEFQSPRVFGVARRKGEWLGVQASELPNGELAWVSANAARLACTTWSLHADLSDRTLFVRHKGRPVRELAVGIGSAESPTPEGRFSVTDKLRWNDPGSPYGCCVLALSGHQTKLPASWSGGDRLAVHATPDLASIGRADTLGCLRAGPRQMRWLIETIPLGAPVFVRS